MIILDTHTLLWWLHDVSRLSQEARQVLEVEERSGTLYVSAISIWEVAVKVSLGKLSLPVPVDQWYERARSYPGVVVEALTPLDAIESTRLPGIFHKDPADRIIVAVARRRGVPVVTNDQRIRDYPHVRTIW